MICDSCNKSHQWAKGSVLMVSGYGIFPPGKKIEVECPFISDTKINSWYNKPKCQKQNFKTIKENIRKYPNDFEYGKIP